ncbi:MAG: beta-ketoacyl-[acyl-carrier-protein] synthase family protein [Sedimentisphaerales bacterium]|nr:beta-ketoacyl-[acyl-carrier-protein] synthase family protein [Sedimentisphaerales bacterium]
MRQIDQAVPVTGLGCLCAAGGSVAKLAESLFAGRRSIGWREVNGSRYPVFQLDSLSVPPGYDEGPECKRCGRLAIAATDEAMTHAGLTGEWLQRRRVGVCMGTTVGSAMNNELFYRDFRAARMPGVEPIRHYLQANPAAMVAQAFHLTGPCQTITNACSSGAVAIGHAAEWLRAGACDVVIAGGADMLCNVIHAGFLSLLITDVNPCRPFDRNRQGLNLGEGAGVVVLESRQSAQERDAPIQAWLRGYGNASDAYHISAPEPNGRGLRRAIEWAMAHAGLHPQEIDFINAHGTGTPENDRVEGRLFPEMFPGAPFGSTKGFTGHTLGAAGGIEAVITVLCLQQRRVPANIGFEEPDPDFLGRPVVENTSIAGKYGLSDSAAFGGNNAALIFQGQS